MKYEAQEFLKGEYDSLHKMAYESQFNHFMGVFYFWIAVVTFPATAGLIAHDRLLDNSQFGLLLAFLAVLGIFLSAKMFDIRCSQLKYITMINEVRYHLYSSVKDMLPNDVMLTFNRNTNLQRVALTDFGMIMSVVMSLINGVYGFGAAIMLGIKPCGSASWGIGTGLFSLGIYFVFVLKKIPKPKLSPNQANSADAKSRAAD